MNNGQEKTIEHILGRMQTDQAVDPPADAVKYVQNLFRTRSVEPQASMLHRILAVLRADLKPDRLAFGERSAATGHIRQMFFESGDNAVDLRISPAGTGFDIRGQVLGDGFELAALEITGPDRTFTSTADDMSSFRFSSIPAGEYSISIRGRDFEIYIESLEID